MRAKQIFTVEKNLDSPNKGLYAVRMGDQVAHSLCPDEALGVVARLLFGDGQMSYINSMYPEPKEMFCTACCQHWEQGSHYDRECPHCGVVALIGVDQGKAVEQTS